MNFVKNVASKAWEFLKALLSRLFTYALRYPVAVVLSVLLIAAVAVLFYFGKTVQVGGLLGRLWGRGSGSTPNLRAVVPPARVDAAGNPIPVGASDGKGFVQAVQVPMKEPGILSNPSTVTVVHPDRGVEVIDLPAGVKNTDVKTVIEISPKVYQIENHDSGVDARKILDSL